MRFFKFSGKAQIPVAILGTLFLSGISIYKISYGSVLQNISTEAKLIPIFVITVAGIVMGSEPVMNATARVNISIFRVLPAEQVSLLNNKAAVAVSEKRFDSSGATLIHLGILLSIFGGLNGNTMTTTRVPFAMGERGALPFPSRVGRAHPQFQTPANAIILQISFGGRDAEASTGASPSHPMPGSGSVAAL